MKAETIENILNFLQNNEGKKLPKSWFKSLEKLKLIEELETLPDGVQYKYEDNLYLNNSNIKKLPNDLHVDGSLYLKDTNITELPNKLYVNGYFYIRETSIEELPNDLHVVGSLDLDDCKKLTKLPDYLYVGLNLYIKNTPLAKKYTDEEIYEMITSKGGTLIGQIIR